MDNNKESIPTTNIPNVDREVHGLSPVPEKMVSTIIIPISEYAELLSYKGRYEELKDICNNKLTSPILRPDAVPAHHPWQPGVRSGSVTYDSLNTKAMEESNENHIPGV